MNPNALITSMFVRRLLILSSGFLLILLILTGQLYRLTVVHGEELRSNAERVLIKTRLLPTFRGKVLDRKGRIIAEDRPCFDVLVDYRLINGDWATNQATREARKALGKRWDNMNRDERSDTVQSQFRSRYDRQVDDIWGKIAQLADTPLDEIVQKQAEIEQRVERMANHIWGIWLTKERQEFPGANLTIDDVKKPIREQEQAHVIVRRIDASKEALFHRFAADGPRINTTDPAITIQSAGTRSYPQRDVTIAVTRSSLPSPLRFEEPLDVTIDQPGQLILGSMRDRVYKADIDRNPLRIDRKIVNLDGYEEGDHVGSTGMERAFEDTLRGSRGFIIEHLETGNEERTPPKPGDNVQLSIDIQLQARIQAMLDPKIGLTRVQPWHGHESQLPIGTPLSAAVVVQEIETGELLALVSHTPPEWDEIGLDSPDGIGATPDTFIQPRFINRAIYKSYNCGSIVKPLMYCGAVSEGAWPSDKVVECNGHFFPNDPEHYRCWIYRQRFGLATHGPLDPVEAIGRSCNIYFYTISDTLGAQRLSNWYRKWGIGQSFHLGLATSPGLIGRPDQLDRGAVVMMGIGQGPVAWTPLHAANAYSALARGGYYTEPTLVIQPSPDVIGERLREDLELDGPAIDHALRGIYNVIHNQQHGGARQIDINPDPAEAEFEPIFNIDSIATWGKTGTAQHSPWPMKLFVMDEHGEVRRGADGKPILVTRTKGIGAHSWFVGLAGAAEGEESNTKAQPKYAISVLVEWGGSGSRCAGTIANQVMQALKDEGYLAQ